MQETLRETDAITAQQDDPRRQQVGSEESGQAREGEGLCGDGAHYLTLSYSPNFIDYLSYFSYKDLQHCHW